MVDPICFLNHNMTLIEKICKKRTELVNVLAKAAQGAVSLCLFFNWAKVTLLLFYIIKTSQHYVLQNTNVIQISKSSY